MNGALSLVAIGLLLIALLVVLLRRTEPTADDSFSSLASLRFEDRRTDILDRIFGRDDWDFVRNHTSTEIRRLFLLERKKIALFWLSEIRGEAKAAMRFHVAHARTSEKLLAMQELKLAVDYVAIRVKCAFIAVIILLRGPVALRGMVGRASHLSGQFQGWLEAVLQADAFAEKSGVSE